MFGRKGCGALTNYMDQLYRWTFSDTISIKYLIPQENRRAQEAIMILEHNSTTTKLK